MAASSSISAEAPIFLAISERIPAARGPQTVFNEKVLKVTLSLELVARLGAAIDSVAGLHTVHPVPFGTDAARIQDAGIPAVVFGPGDIAQAHTKDEWIDLAQLEPAAEILYRFAAGK